MSFHAFEENYADLDTLQSLAALVDMVPTHLCVFSGGRISFILPNLHFSRRSEHLSRGSIKFRQMSDSSLHLTGLTRKMSDLQEKRKVEHEKTAATGTTHRCAEGISASTARHCKVSKLA